MPDTMIERIAQALEPFAGFIEWAERNGHPFDELDLLVRRDGRVLGHAGFTIADLTAARDTKAMIDAALAEGE